MKSDTTLLPYEERVVSGHLTSGFHSFFAIVFKERSILTDRSSGLPTTVAAPKVPWPFLERLVPSVRGLKRVLNLRAYELLPLEVIVTASEMVFRNLSRDLSRSLDPMAEKRRNRKAPTRQFSFCGCFGRKAPQSADSDADFADPVLGPLFYEDVKSSRLPVQSQDVTDDSAVIAHVPLSASTEVQVDEQLGIVHVWVHPDDLPIRFVCDTPRIVTNVIRAFVVYHETSPEEWMRQAVSSVSESVADSNSSALLASSQKSMHSNSSAVASNSHHHSTNSRSAPVPSSSSVPVSASVHVPAPVPSTMVNRRIDDSGTPHLDAPDSPSPTAELLSLHDLKSPAHPEHDARPLNPLSSPQHAARSRPPASYQTHNSTKPNTVVRHNHNNSHAPSFRPRPMDEQADPFDETFIPVEDARQTHAAPSDHVRPRSPIYATQPPPQPPALARSSSRKVSGSEVMSAPFSPTIGIGRASFRRSPPSAAVHPIPSSAIDTNPVFARASHPDSLFANSAYVTPRPPSRTGSSSKSRSMDPFSSP